MKIFSNDNDKYFLRKTSATMIYVCYAHWDCRVGCEVGLLIRRHWTRCFHKLHSINHHHRHRHHHNLSNAPQFSHTLKLLTLSLSSVTRTLAHSYTHSLNHRNTHSFTLYQFTHSLAHSAQALFAHSLTYNSYSLTHSLTHPLTHTDWLTDSLTHSPTHSLTHEKLIHLLQQQLLKYKGHCSA
jgi:hypothetical protein